MNANAVSNRFPEARSNRRTAHVPAASPAAPRVNIQTILVPTDFSEGSNRAVKFAARLAAQFDAKLILLHVIEPVATPDFAYYPLMMENDEAVAAAKKGLSAFAHKAGLRNSIVQRTVVRNGVPYNEISKAAAALKANLIVIATHGYTGLKHALLGSTAERVVRHAKCPVLVVRGR
jgi:nucleotide-binding universal stress UspA family protein